MAPEITQPSFAAVAELAAAQHGVVSRRQLLGLGVSEEAIRHRLRKGRLHRLRDGVFALGRPDLTQYGLWMAAVLSCGPGAVLSHRAGGALWGLRPWQGRLDVTVPATRDPRRPGIRVHRRRSFGATTHQGIAVTDPASTLVDLATLLAPVQLESAVNEADKLDLIDPGTLRAEIDRMRNRSGVPALRSLLDRDAFTLTDSELERLFLPITRRSGLGRPLTGTCLNGHRVDFHWPELGLVVETDGLRYHRTPAQQAKDRRRDQDHTAAGLTALRFTHGQIKFEARRVTDTLARVADRLRRSPAPTDIGHSPSR